SRRARDPARHGLPRGRPDPVRLVRHPFVLAPRHRDTRHVLPGGRGAPGRGGGEAGLPPGPSPPDTRCHGGRAVKPTLADVPPHVMWVEPEDGAEGVLCDSVVLVRFSPPIDPESLASLRWRCPAG